MKYFKYRDLIVYIPLTFLIIYDYFPYSPLSEIIPINLNVWIILILYLIAILFNQGESSNNTENITGQILYLIYLFSLLILLTILGGESASGIGLNNIGIWIALVLSIGEIYSRKQKLSSINRKKDRQNNQ
jgi:hypothetical protein